MRRWLYDNPWIWIVVFLVVMVGANLAFLTIAEYNRPIMVEKTD